MLHFFSENGDCRHIELAFFVLSLFNCGADDIDLTALVDLFLDKGIESCAVAFVNKEGIDPLSAGRHLVNL
jgi:hypothetical protein